VYDRVPKEWEKESQKQIDVIKDIYIYEETCTNVKRRNGRLLYKSMCAPGIGLKPLPVFCSIGRGYKGDTGEEVPWCVLFADDIV